jgi:hypothetical protein
MIKIKSYQGMGQRFLSLASGFFFLLVFDVALGQAGPPVVWHFDAAPVVANEAVLSFSARVAPGWHLYSQHLKEGGPIATRFRFQPGDDYILSGTTLEKGTAQKFYDDIYEMDIIWYSGDVTFSQSIRLLKPVTTIKGTVEYMTCNLETCIPAERAFSIEVSQ